MKSPVVLLLLLCLTVETRSATENRFFISAPNVFHKGVEEKVFVQMGAPHVNVPVTLHLEHESTGTVVSERKTIRCTSEQDIKIVELMINDTIMSRFPPPKHGPPYLLLVADSAFSQGRRQATRVLVSKHRGYIFIQTNQPIYKPEQGVSYRIFTLDHTLRPNEETFSISIFNAAGIKVMNSLKLAHSGIFSDTFQIPDVSQPGTWRITAHYPDDEANAVSREFKVQKFVLPSFEVNIQTEQKYIVLSAEEDVFTISAMYTHGENVKGAYHTQFGVLKKSETVGEKVKPVIVKGLELTGSVQDGKATVSLQRAKLNNHLQTELNLTLSDLQQSGAQVYMAVFVTDINSGEMQYTEVNLPVLSHKYTMDLSRTRSYFLPGYPLDVVVIMRLPDGSPAPGVRVRMAITGPSLQSMEVTTGQEGAVFHTFNIETSKEITVEVSADGLHQRKTLKQASSTSDSYLYMSFSYRLYSVSDEISVTYMPNTGSTAGFIYYMVLSRGIIVKKGSLPFGRSVKDSLLITHDMVPSFRLIGYFYNEHGDIIADSVWVDVREECGIKVKVEQIGSMRPGKQSALEFDLHGQRAKVALLAVDKAFYALNADNKLTAKQVFSAMQSYDLGCSRGGGSDSASVLVEAGLSFISQSQSKNRMDFGCGSASARQRRSVNLQLELMSLKSNFSDKDLQECCDHGFSLIPMTLTCEQRAKRVSLVRQSQPCVDAFLQCCRQGEHLRKEKIREEARKGVGRTESMVDIEQFFMDTAAQYIRRYFPPSFEFKEFLVDGKRRYPVTLPDSITTWEFQVVTLSAATGFCVVQPTEVRAFKEKFVSLRLPYSVKVFEQMFISPVIYNYGSRPLQLAVHMEQSEGLCSPGSATTAAFVNVTVEPASSKFVTFSAVPMVTGSIPIKIRLYDMVEGMGVDAIQKNLNVMVDGQEHRVEKSMRIELDGRSTKDVSIDGTLPNEVIPDSESSLFVSAEAADGFETPAKNLLSPKKVSALIVLPTGCLEQTMVRLAPTASALRYLDLSEQWSHLPTGTRDDALDKIVQGYIRILSYKKPDGSYGAWSSVPSSNWVTALVVKVLSLVAQRQTVAFGTVGHMTEVVPTREITDSVSYLLSVQKTDGSFTDPHPVLHREVLNRKDQDAAMTAFITLSLRLSLQFLPAEVRNNVGASTSRATSYLMSNIEGLEHPYAIATTAYCLAVCRTAGEHLPQVWTKLRSKATEGKDGYLWTTDISSRNQKRADAITVETTAYGLLAAVELGHMQEADKAARWLVSQQNYFGGYTSSQDTIMALEALAEYELKRPANLTVNVNAEFTVPGKIEIASFTLRSRESVEIDLKKLSGKQITMQLSGKGTVTVKTMKAFYLLNTKDDCPKVSISVTVEGKVKYTALITDMYEYYDDVNNNEEQELLETQSDIELADDRTRSRRDVDNNVQSSQVVTYTVCVGRSTNNSLTGMAIADITLLSGFDAEIEDLDKLKRLPEQYISHYESYHGRVLIYFNQLFEAKECISFDAKQTVPIGLLQPAPAVFYDYYEPSQKCTVFYSAPQRTRLVSKLCSGDVCQCAERPCLNLKMTFKSERGEVLKKRDRSNHACFFPRVDYAYIVDVLSVSMRLNFELYNTTVTEILRKNGDLHLRENSVRVFAKRRQCKVKLTVGKTYLIMGKDGATTDSNGQMQYLLESNTWVEKKPSVQECIKSAHRAACKDFSAFVDEYKLDGCRQ